ncbi:mechanosensitive ion channel protein MscS, partial [Mycobacterium sp. ITM-2017-0098]
MDDAIQFDSATQFAVTAAWVAAALAIAYVVGLAVSWLLQRLGRRSAVLSDIAHLTRLPLRATLVVLAATAAVRRATDPASSWRGWVDHMLVIFFIGALTWVAVSLVRVAERQIIARFAGGDTGLTDADRHRRKIKTQVLTLRRIVVAIVVV